MHQTADKRGTTEYNNIDSPGLIHESRGNLAILAQTDITRMPEILRLIQQVPGTRIIYHRTSLGRLYIVTEEELDWRYEGGNSRRAP
jgi:hypothetical protein